MTTTTDRLDGQGMIGAQTLHAVEAPNVPADQGGPGAQTQRVGGDPFIRSGQSSRSTHTALAVAEQSPESTTASPAPTVLASARAPHSLDGQVETDAHRHRAVEGPNSGDQDRDDTHHGTVAAPTPPAPATAQSTPIPRPLVLADPDDRPAAKRGPAPKVAAPLADPVLSLVAEILDDVEQAHIANANRFRAMTTTNPDKDGVMRGHGLPDDDPRVRGVAALVAILASAEKQATRDLERIMRKHPLGPWAKRHRGVGDKQLARLIAVIGDPYWMTRADGTERARTVAELRSYCGWGDARRQVRRRGERANWSDTAKRRTWVIAESCMKQLVKPCAVPDGQDWAEHVDDCRCSPYRLVYDTARRKYADTLHDVECRRCGPKGKPAQPGSPRAPGHQNAMALRLVSKAILRDLWREAGRLHGADVEAPTDTRGAARLAAAPKPAPPSPGADPHDPDTP